MYHIGERTEVWEGARNLQGAVLLQAAAPQAKTAATVVPNCLRDQIWPAPPPLIMGNHILFQKTFQATFS